MMTKTQATNRPDELYDTKVREVLLEVSPAGGGMELIVGLRVDVLFTVEAESVPASGAN